MFGPGKDGLLTPCGYSATDFSHSLTERGDKRNSMLCSKNLFHLDPYTQICKQIQEGWRLQPLPIAYELRTKISQEEVLCGVPESFNSRNTQFSWRWPQFQSVQLVCGFSPIPPFPRRASTRMWKQREHSAEVGVQREGGSFEVMMKEFYFYGLMRKEEGVCPAWFRLCWRAHWRLFEEASFREEGKKSHNLVFLPSPPTFLPDLTFAAE